MQTTKISRAVSAVALVLSATAASRADFSYNYDNLVGSPNPGTPLVNSTTIGAVGQDNWVLASGVSSLVRTDPITGFSGNYITSATATQAAPSQDSIHTRVGANLGIGGSRYVTFQFDGLVGPAGFSNVAGATQYRRSEIAPGIDANQDGDIRGTSASTENGEVGFQFGFEGTGSGWYVRRAAYSNTGTVTAATTANGVYRMQLVVDFNANPSTVADSVNGGFVNDGAGTLYVKQIADASGNPVNDVFRLADPTTANVNLGLSGMGGFGGANPANWNGFNTRTANNGGIDNVQFTVGLPTNTSTWAADAGNWLSSANWYLGVPNGVDAHAEFTAGARVDSTVYADSPVTAGTIVLNNSAHSYNITGAATLTLQTSAGSALVDVQGGSHKINLPLIVASNTTLNVASGATLRVSDPVTVQAGKSITQTGSGTVLYESTIDVLTGGNIAFGNSLTAASLTLASGANATINSPAAGGKSVVSFDATTLAGGSTLDVKTNELDTGSTQVAVRSLIANGQLISSAAGAKNGLGYGAGANGKTRVVYTIKGDANLDFTTSFADLVALAQNYNGTNKVWNQGDFNYDGNVAFADLVLLAQNYNQSLAGLTLPASFSANFVADWALAQSLVPEPTSLAMLGLPLLVAARRRRM